MIRNNHDFCNVNLYANNMWLIFGQRLSVFPDGATVSAWCNCWNWRECFPIHLRQNTVNYTIILFLFAAGDFWSNSVSAKFVRDDGDWALMFGQPLNANLGLNASWWLGSQLFLTGHYVKGGEELCTPSTSILVLKFVKPVSGVRQAWIIDHCHL